MYPQNTQNDHFQSENQWLVGTTILGDPQIATIIQASPVSR